MKVLGVVGIHLHMVRVGLHFLNYSRCIEGRVVDYVLIVRVKQIEMIVGD